MLIFLAPTLFFSLKFLTRPFLDLFRAVCLLFSRLFSFADFITMKSKLACLPDVPSKVPGERYGVLYYTDYWLRQERIISCFPDCSSCFSENWSPPTRHSVMLVIFATTASYPGQFVLSELPEEAWKQVRILTGDVTSEIAGDDWELTRLFTRHLSFYRSFLTDRYLKTSKVL